MALYDDVFELLGNDLPENSVLRQVTDYIGAHLIPKSASSLRFAVQAARLDYAARVRAKLAAVERLYLDELMKSRDALEGLQAFIAKRPAQWEHC